MFLKYFLLLSPEFIKPLFIQLIYLSGITATWTFIFNREREVWSARNQEDGHVKNLTQAISSFQIERDTECVNIKVDIISDTALTCFTPFVPFLLSGFIAASCYYRLNLADTGLSYWVSLIFYPGPYHLWVDTCRICSTILRQGQIGKY